LCEINSLTATCPLHQSPRDHPGSNFQRPAPFSFTGQAEGPLTMVKVVAIGASQGGVPALAMIARMLPRDFPAAVFVVLHTGPTESILPSILNDAGRLEASHARNGDEILPGHIFVAPPDQHLLLTGNTIELSHGPRENWARPALDPMFRSAAESFGREVAGVVLSGRLNDGTAGLYEIKRRGGVTIVQNPDEAEAPSMPQSAIDNVPVDYCLKVKDIPDLLTRLARAEVARPLAADDHGVHPMPQITPGQPVALTCPECGGAMKEETLGSLTRFRCHIGHVMTAEVLALAQVEDIEKDIGTILRALNERRALCAEMAIKSQASGNSAAAAVWRKAAQEAVEREGAIKSLMRVGWTHPETTKIKA